MTDNFKCPFCKEEIISDLCLMCDKIDKGYTSGRRIYKCNKCGLFGNKELVQELIRTRKALGVAVDAIDEILYLDSGKFCKEPAEMWKIAKSAKDEITALEQKD